MKRTLRKGSSHVHVTYRNGGFTNNLWGREFTLEDRDNTLVLGIDMSSNLRVRNKQSNAYLDAAELAEQWNEVEFIQLESDLVLEPLSSYWHRMRNPSIVLSLSLGNHGCARYDVKPEVLGISLQLNVLQLSLHAGQGLPSFSNAANLPQNGER
jgi:hypothetical protein